MSKKKKLRILKRCSVGKKNVFALSHADRMKNLRTFNRCMEKEYFAHIIGGGK